VTIRFFVYICNMKLGYACINMTLGSQKPKITTNRGMIRKTFDSKGLTYVSELALQNVRDLATVVSWNHRNGIQFYRMSSDMFPWMSEYEFTDLPDHDKISNILRGIGTMANEYGQRLSFHPGPFNVLCSPKQDVVDKTVRELNKHSQIMDIMGLSTTPYNKINIHVGGVYGDKQSALQRWCDNFELLDDNTKSRLTIENDDKTSAYTVRDLMYIHENTGIPIVFDYHHHSCHPDGMSHKDALTLAVSTWPTGITPAVHVSEPRDDKNPRAHHDYIRTQVDTYGFDIDIMMEAKAKEQALLEYRTSFENVLVDSN
jgi:UV DNA damage endonuclease